MGQKHYVEGVVYAPNILDTDGETMLAADIKKMAHDFIASGKVLNIDTGHDNIINGCEVVESFIAKSDDPTYPEGAWVLGIRVDEENPTWEMISKGELNGFSVQMRVNKVAKKVITEVAKIFFGDTEDSVSADEVPVHKHSIYVEFNADGTVGMAVCEKAYEHTHDILTTTATATKLSHSHRFFVE